MTTTEALAAVKKRLSVSTTDFDAQLTDFFETAVNRLFPKAMIEADAQTISVSVDNYGEATVDLLTVDYDDVRSVDATTGENWFSADRLYRHGTTLRVRDLPTNTVQLRLYGLLKYNVVDDAVDLPSYLEQPVYWFMMSEFFDMLAGSKAKFNVYTQNAGGNAVDDMRTEADYYEAKAENYLDEKAVLYGA